MTSALRILMDQRHQFLLLLSVLLVIAVAVGGWLAVASLASGVLVAVAYDRLLQ